MPINATQDYYLAEERYLQADTREEKIAALQDMIRELPKHKGTENLLGQLKKSSTVKDLALGIHKDFYNDFRFARIFDNTNFSGRKVGLKYKLKEKDVVEINT